MGKLTEPLRPEESCLRSAVLLLRVRLSGSLFHSSIVFSMVAVAFFPARPPEVHETFHRRVLGDDSLVKINT